MASTLGHFNSRPSSGGDAISSSGDPTSRSTFSVQTAPVPVSPHVSNLAFYQQSRLHFTYTPWKLASYIFFVVFCNLALPCLIFYVIREYAHKIDLRTNIGIASASLGLSSCFDAPFRLYKLTKYRNVYGPLKDDVWWHADFFMWTYTFALFCFAFPLAIAPAVNPVAVDFFLMSTAMLMLPFGVVLAFTLTRARLPVWCSSDPPYTPLKPGAFYCLEDLGAVDFQEGRAWRQVCHDRYAVSPPFRSLMRILTYYWIVATIIYFGATAAVTWASWTLEFSFAFVLGQLFIWLGLASLGCWFIVQWGLEREKAWWDNVRAGESKPVHTTSIVKAQEEQRGHERGTIVEMTETRTR